MKLFSKLYAKVITWSRHRHAPYYLASVSFAESSFFPIPPDVMLISMSLAEPKNAWRYATVASISSVLGGILGYILGACFIQFVYPLLTDMGYGPQYQQVQHWFQLWGFWVVFLAGFSPIPYKLFTIGAGAMRMAFLPFLLASFISRSLRFFLVCGAMYWGGERLHQFIHKYIDLLGWLMVAIFALVYILWRTGVI